MSLALHTHKKETQDLFLPLPPKQLHTWSTQAHSSTRRQEHGIPLEASVIPSAICCQSQAAEDAMFPICCTNRHQGSDQALPVQPLLLHWAGVTTPTLGAATYTHLRKAPKSTAQWERRDMAHWEHRKRSQSTDALQLKQSGDQERKGGKTQGKPWKGSSISRLYLPFEFQHFQNPFLQGFSFFSILPTTSALVWGEARSCWNHGILSQVW